VRDDRLSAALVSTSRSATARLSVSAAGTGASGRVAMCAWSDNDSFGILTSPALNAASLADLMVQDRPLIELVKK
jgi:hypothetical protein